MHKLKFIILTLLFIIHGTKSFPILKFREDAKDFSYLEQLKKGEFKTLKKRIQSEGSPNLIFNKYNGSLLYYAVLLDKKVINENQKQYKNLLKTLIKFGVDYTIKDKILGKTPIHYAVINKNYIALYVFCKHINPQGLNIQDSDGNTPLHLAFKLFDEMSISILMGIGVDMEIKNYSGITTIDLLRNIHEENSIEYNDSFEYFEQITKFIEKIKTDYFDFLFD